MAHIYKEDINSLDDCTIHVDYGWEEITTIPIAEDKPLKFIYEGRVIEYDYTYETMFSKCSLLTSVPKISSSDISRLMDLKWGVASDVSEDIPELHSLDEEDLEQLIQEAHNY